MRQLCALKLEGAAGVARPQGKVSRAIQVVVKRRGHSEAALRGRDHDDCLSLGHALCMRTRGHLSSRHALDDVQRWPNASQTISHACHNTADHLRHGVERLYLATHAVDEVLVLPHVARQIHLNRPRQTQGQSLPIYYISETALICILTSTPKQTQGQSQPICYISETAQIGRAHV